MPITSYHYRSENGDKPIIITRVTEAEILKHRQNMILDNPKLSRNEKVIQLLYQTKDDIEHKINQLMDTEVDEKEIPHVLSNISVLLEKLNKLDKIVKIQRLALQQSMNDFAAELFEDREKEISEYDQNQNQIQQRMFWDMIQESCHNNTTR